MGVTPRTLPVLPSPPGVKREGGTPGKIERFVFENFRMLYFLKNAEQISSHLSGQAVRGKPDYDHICR